MFANSTFRGLITAHALGAAALCLSSAELPARAETPSAAGLEKTPSPKENRHFGTDPSTGARMKGVWGRDGVELSPPEIFVQDRAGNWSVSGIGVESVRWDLEERSHGRLRDGRLFFLVKSRNETPLASPEVHVQGEHHYYYLDTARTELYRLRGRQSLKEQFEVRRADDGSEVVLVRSARGRGELFTYVRNGTRLEERAIPPSRLAPVR